MDEKREILPPEASDVIFMGAIAAIFRGDLESGLPHIAGLAAEGYERAAGTQAQIAAYQNDWAEAGDYAGQMLLNPASGASHDMYLDMWRILALSAIHRGDWLDANEVVETARKIYANAFSNKKHPRLKYLNTFAKFITTGGGGELPYPIFPKPHIDHSEATSLLAGLESYHIERSSCTRAWPTETMKATAARQDIYNAAMDYYLPAESVGCYEHCKIAPEGYNQRLFLAKALVMAGAKQEAKQILQLASDAYIPHDLGDLMPVGALWDPDCRKIVQHIQVDKLLLRKRKTAVGGIHKINVDKIAAINSRNEHLRLLSEQASFADIHRWEEQISGDTFNLDLRTLLLHCYRDRIKLYTDCAQQHARHVLWVIKNAPATALAGDALCHLTMPGQAAYYQQGKAAWLDVLRRKKTTSQMVLNAANYLRYDASGE
ncbi:MAG: hypothetical protein JSS86_05445 [Cyanobacteria bacterium SZAS LIN-2]|nr:hypothetical protein [Cyanobacteria bacterium SZAS LIN-2]MBS2009408.1 hypothetical protein [Cyanobacteria bacterium SZAS TMP-1]